MNKLDRWPPPDWPEVIVKWDLMLESPSHNPNMIVTWVNETTGGRYHLHGHNTAEGFAFRFEDPKDATLFALKWV
jgi:hypothetical protein